MIVHIRALPGHAVPFEPRSRRFVPGDTFVPAIHTNWIQSMIEEGALEVEPDKPADKQAEKAPAKAKEASGG